jgi:CheY-like chemotaxis protein
MTIGAYRTIAASPTAEPGRLLLIDDNAPNRDLLLRRLERIGHQVTVADDERSALEILQARVFDLVLLSIAASRAESERVLQRVKTDPSLRHIPVIVLAGSDNVGHVARSIQLGAEDYLSRPFDPVLLRARINACLQKKRLHDIEQSYVTQIKKEKKRADDLLNVVIPIGVALSAEKDFNRLLEKIVVEAQALCNADGGTLYLRGDDDTLQWVIVRNTSLCIALGGATGRAIDFAPLPMYDTETGQPNYRYVVTHAALTGQTINIADAYNTAGFDFSGTRAFDRQTGYRSRSFVNVPLKDSTDRVIGVLQLLNAQDPDTGAVVPFDPGQQQTIESLSALAAVAVAAYAREQRLRQQIEELRIEVDEVRQARQVAEITETDYFLQLQSRARHMRTRGAGEPHDRKGYAPV